MKPKTKTEGWEKKFEKEFFPRGEEDKSNCCMFCFKIFVKKLLKTQRLEIVRELDKKYNKICEEKVRETAQDIVGEIEKEIYMVDYIKDKDGEWKNWQQQKRVLTALKQKYGK